MTEPAPRDQTAIDRENLKLLAIFHFVGAGFALFGLLMIYVHYRMFSDVVTNPQLWQREGAPPMPAMPVDMLAIMKWVYIVLAALIVGSGLLNLLVALALRRRTLRVFSIVVAAVNCLYFPLGTALGVFTIIVLSRESVRQLYQPRRS